MPSILVVDDEPSICWGLVKLGESLGHKIESAASAEEGLRLASQNPPDLLILDVRLPGIDGLSAMEQFRSALSDAPIIIMTAFGDLETAVRAVRQGAFEYLVKPFDLAEVRSTIERSLRPASEPVETVTPSEAVDQMIGNTPAMQVLFKRIALASASQANVVILGESGVGKELVARAIHRHSSRDESPFVAVNIAALSPTLAESELFGHVDGAFTGANRRREGLLGQADGGTLFLDEVADIPMPLQVKLLRALEQQEVLPVGSNETVKTSFRVVAATHRDLQALVRAGEFRHDLYYRLFAFEIAVPSLRERVDDIMTLAAHFASRCGDGPVSFAKETISVLRSREWHGNVRELRSAIEHARVVSRTGTLLPEHLPSPLPRLWPGSDLQQPDGSSLVIASSQWAADSLNDPENYGELHRRLMHEVEGPLLQQAMQHFDNECAPAARALGLHRTTLRKKLTEHDM